MDNKFKIQEDQYSFPYHYIVDFNSFKSGISMAWGIEYYGYIKRILDIIDFYDFNSFLDVGCGDGKLIFELNKKYPNKKIVGVDLSKRAIIFAKAFNYGNGADFYDVDVSEIKDRFDIITVIETIEHVPNEKLSKFIDNIYKKMNDGGILIISVPSKNIPLQAKHYRHYDLNLLLSQFDRFKFKKVDYMIRGGWFYNLMIRLSRKFSNFSQLNKIFLFLGEKFLFKANKKNARHIIGIFKK